MGSAMQRLKLPAIVFAMLLGLSMIALPRIEAQGLVKSSGGASVAGSDTQVQFNDNGVLNGDAGLTFNKTTDLLTFTGTANNSTVTFVSRDWTYSFSDGLGNGFRMRNGAGEGFVASVTAMKFPSSYNVGWNSAGDPNSAAADAAIGRNAAGVLEVNNGSSGTYRDLLARQVRTDPVAVASLQTCNAGNKGARSFVTDANATTFLSTVAAGGANNVPVVCNGTNWVIG